MAPKSMILSSLQQLPEAFYKTVGDHIYELEVYPKFLYYAKINEKGERPHEMAIVNQTIDQNYMKKVIKSEKIPFKEIYLSRKTTFEELLQIVSEEYKENSKRGRLWIEENVIAGAKLEETLEDFGISIGQVVYVEYSNAQNQWPSDKLGMGSSFVNKLGEKKDEDITATSGLYNLGNSN